MHSFAGFLRNALTRGERSFCNDEYLDDDQHLDRRFQPFCQSVTPGWQSFASRKLADGVWQAVDGDNRITHFFYEQQLSQQLAERRHALRPPQQQLFTASDLCSAHIRRGIAELLQKHERPLSIGTHKDAAILQPELLPEVTGQVANHMANFMALFSAEVLNGVVPEPLKEHEHARKAATADLLEAAAAKVFWDEDLPLPAGSCKRVSGSGVGSHVLRYMDWDSDSDDDGGLDSMSDADQQSSKQQQHPPQPTIGTITGVSADGLFYVCALHPGLDEELEEKEVWSGLVLRAPAAVLFLGGSSVPTFVSEGSLIELTEDCAAAVGQPQHSLWRCVGLWLGQRQAVYLELHAVADQRRSLKHFKALLHPGEVVQIGQDTIVATAQQIQHVLPAVEVTRMLPCWTSAQLLPMPPAQNLPLGGQPKDNDKQFWATVFVGQAFLGRMKWNTARLHVIKYICMPKQAVQELFGALRPRSAGDGSLQLVLSADMYTDARAAVFALGSWPGFPELPAGPSSADIMVVQQAGVKLKWTPSRGARLPRLRVEYYFSKCPGGGFPMVPEVEIVF